MLTTPRKAAIYTGLNWGPGRIVYFGGDNFEECVGDAKTHWRDLAIANQTVAIDPPAPEAVNPFATWPFAEYPLLPKDERARK